MSSALRGAARSVIAVLLITLVAACSGPARPGSTSEPISDGSSSASTSSSANTPIDVPDPRLLTGPTTAQQVAPVEPITPAPTPQLPVTVTDDKGTSVTVTSVDRILALDIYGTLTETVIGLGLGDNLAGRTTSTTDPNFADLPNVTPGGHELNAEAILALAPTVVLADGTLGPQEVYQQLARAGVAVVFTSPDRGVDLIEGQIGAVAAALGVPEAGTQLAERVAGELEDAAAAVAELAPDINPLRMAFVYARGSGSVFFIFGDGSGADGLIGYLGGLDVASEAGITGYKPATAEALATINPEVILMMSSGLESAGGLDGVLARPGVAQTTAGQTQRFVDMEDGQVLSFGPNYPKVIESLAAAIYLAQ